MNNKNIIILIVFVLGFTFFLRSAKTPQEDKPSPTEEIIEKITYINATADLIIAELPFPGAVTGKEFGVIGKARGYWFFEGSFPIDLLDQNGKIIAQGYAQADGEWMTENFVPFKGTIKAPESYIGKATLVLKKNNASGLQEHDASISFPITVEY
jgi:hypothetical protein